MDSTTTTTAAYSHKSTVVFHRLFSSSLFLNATEEYKGAKSIKLVLLYPGTQTSQRNQSLSLSVHQSEAKRLYEIQNLWLADRHHLAACAAALEVSRPAEPLTWAVLHLTVHLQPPQHLSHLTSCQRSRLSTCWWPNCPVWGRQRLSETQNDSAGEASQTLNWLSITKIMVIDN